DLNGSYGVSPGTDSKGGAKFAEMVEANDFKLGTYAGESYDSAAIILLAMQAAGSSNSSDFKLLISKVANAPGEKILAGELASGLKILAEGGDIDYVGATDIELIEPGESAGNFREIEIKDGKLVTSGMH
ncbi:MAG: branched-chain amino acid ABC transporter substrate-binding protein, partial [Rhizobiales bacterium]|nr:branched-chain amino acid ABC transporter substrate-binding protein [Hyphomicrobiales bacterium]